MRGMQKDNPRLHCREGHRKKDEIPQKSLSVKIWKWRLKILFRCMKNTREPNPAIFLVTPHRISSGTEVKQWWASHSVSILLYHQRLPSPWLQRLIMATFLPISMRLLNCQIAPQHHGLKKNGCDADSIRTEFKLAAKASTMPPDPAPVLPGMLLAGLPLHP